jgi:hypothetical protein
MSAGISRRGILGGLALGAGAVASGDALAEPGSFGLRSDGDPEANTRALNDAVKSVAEAGGGTVLLERARDGYSVAGPVLLPSNVTIDLNGQLVRGRRGADDVLIKTAAWSQGNLTANLDSAPESRLVNNASVRNGRIEDCRRVFHFRNFGQGCTISDIRTRGCIQVGRFERCFYAALDNVSAAGFSDPAIPTFHFVEETNAVILRRVSATTGFGFCLEGGAAGVIFEGCAAEGGTTAVRLIGDCRGIVFSGCFLEGITGTAFDFTQAGVCSVDWRGNVLTRVNRVIDDGGAASGATLSGEWAASNSVTNIAGPGLERFRAFRGEMRVAGPRNFITFEQPYRNNASALDDRWVTSPNTRLSFESGQMGVSLTDVRARGRFYGGIVPTVRGGDTGAPVAGTVPFAELRWEGGADATLTVITGLRWQPDSLFAKFILRIVDDTGSHRLFGDIFGDAARALDQSGKILRIVQVAGFLALQVPNLSNRSGRASCTGTVQLVS